MSFDDLFKNVPDFVAPIEPPASLHDRARDRNIAEMHHAILGVAGGFMGATVPMPRQWTPEMIAADDARIAAEAAAKDAQSKKEHEAKLAEHTLREEKTAVQAQIEAERAKQQHEAELFRAAVDKSANAIAAKLDGRKKKK